MCIQTSSNFSDVTNPATARSNLYVYSKSDSDNILLNEESNLSDLTNHATARTNLNVHSTSEADGVYLNAGSNLGDLGDVVAARNTLNVHAKTEAAAAYLDSASNLSDIGSVESALINLGLDQSLLSNVSNSHSRADIGNLRVYFGTITGVSHNQSKVISVSENCFASTQSYIVIGSVSGDISGDTWAISTSKVSACSWKINNHEWDSSQIDWIAVGLGG